MFVDHQLDPNGALESSLAGFIGIFGLDFEDCNRRGDSAADAEGSSEESTVPAITGSWAVADSHAASVAAANTGAAAWSV